MLEIEITRLYQEYSNQIYRYLFSLTKSEEDAKDILQDVFIAAIKYLTSKIENPKSWLYKIAYNEFLAYIKKNKNYENNSEFTNFEDKSNFTDQVHWQMLRTQILECLRKQNELYLHIFILRLDQELKHPEIFEALNIPESTYFRYLDNIKRIIKNNFQETLKDF